MIQLKRLLRLHRLILLSVAVLATFIVGLLDYVTGAELSISILYLVPVGLSAWLISRFAGLAIAFISGIVWFFADVLASPSYVHPAIPYWNALVMMGLFASFVNLLCSWKRAVDRENVLAKNVQLGMLPKKIPHVDGLKIATVWRPADSVGGDHYDIVVPFTNALGLCIGDASGHGMPAALLMAHVQAAFRLIAVDSVDPQRVCETMNRFICRNELPESLVSFFYVLYDANEKKLTFTNAGHPSPIMLRGDGRVQRLSSGGPLLGISPNVCYEQKSIDLDRGDLLLLFTDGVSEAHNAQQEQYGEERLIDVACRNRGATPGKINDAIIKSLSNFGGNTLHDDVTIVTILFDGANSRVDKMREPQSLTV